MLREVKSCKLAVESVLNQVGQDRCRAAVSLDHAKRAAQRDDLANHLGVLPRKLPGVETAEAPADEADLLSVAVIQLFEAALDSGGDGLGWADISPESPAMGPVALLAELPPKRLG